MSVLVFRGGVSFKNGKAHCQITDVETNMLLGNVLHAHSRDILEVRPPDTAEVFVSWSQYSCTQSTFLCHLHLHRHQCEFECFAFFLLSVLHIRLVFKEV